MIRKINFFLTLACILAFTGVYALKFSIEGIAAEKRALEFRIAEQEADLSLLRADWAILTQPGHIEPIIVRHQEVLALAKVGPRQFGSFSDLPLRPPRPDRAALDGLFEMLEAGIDPIAAILEEID